MKHTCRFPIGPKWPLYLRLLDLDAADVLKRAALPADLFAAPGAGLTSTQYFRLWSVLAASSEDPAFPVSLVENMSTSMFDPPLFAAYCSPTFNIALERLSKFKPLICPMRVDIRKTAETTEVEPGFLERDSTPPPVLVALELAFFVQLARLGTGVRVEPLRVLTPVELGGAGRYREFFGVEPLRGERMSVIFAASDAELPFVSVNPKMWEFFEPGLQQRLSRLGQGTGVSERVRAVLMEALPAGESSIDAVAARLALGRRTLQRRLADEGTSFQLELGAVREKLARHYLANTDLPGSQISFLLGFDDPNSFFRAFHGWTGSTPERTRGTRPRSGD